MSKDKNVRADKEAYYERIASQEEFYLEETEEDVRAILISCDTSPSQDSGSASANNREEQELDRGKVAVSDANDDPCIAESLDEQLDHAAEELITGDSDDPPLSEEAVVETVRITSNARRLGPM
jgi:hypothetical protein